MKHKAVPKVYNAAVFTDLSLYKWTHTRIRYVGYGLEQCANPQKEGKKTAVMDDH